MKQAPFGEAKKSPTVQLWGPSDWEGGQSVQACRARGLKPEQALSTEVYLNGGPVFEFGSARVVSRRSCSWKEGEDHFNIAPVGQAPQGHVEARGVMR